MDPGAGSNRRPPQCHCGALVRSVSGASFSCDASDRRNQLDSNQNRAGVVRERNAEESENQLDGRSEQPQGVREERLSLAATCCVGRRIPFEGCASFLLVLVRPGFAVRDLSFFHATERRAARCGPLLEALSLARGACELAGRR